MQNLRTRIFVIISVIVLVILAILMLILVLSKGEGDIETETTGTVSPTGLIPGTGSAPAEIIPDNIPAKPLTTEEMQKNAAKVMAKVFVERFGSYSTDSNFQNVRDVENLVTANYWQKLEPMIKDSTNSEYVGVSTQVFSTTLEDWGGDSATVKLMAMRVKESSAGTEDSRLEMTVDLVKQGDDWLVDTYTASNI